MVLTLLYLLKNWYLENLKMSRNSEWELIHIIHTKVIVHPSISIYTYTEGVLLRISNRNSNVCNLIFPLTQKLE